MTWALGEEPYCHFLLEVHQTNGIMNYVQEGECVFWLRSVSLYSRDILMHCWLVHEKGTVQVAYDRLPSFPRILFRCI